MALTRERKEHLYNQIVLTIVNDGNWYRAAKPKIDEKHGSGFVHTTGPFLRKAASDIGSSGLNDEERAFVYLHVWEYYGANGEDLLASISANIAIAKPLHHMLMARAGVQPETQPEPQEGQPVNNTTPAFETKHFVFGMDVANMTSGQLLEAIKKIENEIADLKAVKSKSEFIKKRIAELDGMLIKVVEVLDAK